MILAIPVILTIVEILVILAIPVILAFVEILVILEILALVLTVNNSGFSRVEASGVI